VSQCRWEARLRETRLIGTAANPGVQLGFIAEGVELFRRKPSTVGNPFHTLDKLNASEGRTFPFSLFRYHWEAHFSESEILEESASRFRRIARPRVSPDTFQVVEIDRNFIFLADSNKLAHFLLCN
jgi:hypothetical protein